MKCHTCGQAVVANAPGAMYCPLCAFSRGELCSRCRQDAGNGAGGYSECCGQPEVGPHGSGAPIEMHGWEALPEFYSQLEVEPLRALILGTFRRHEVPVGKVLAPVLPELEARGWKFDPEMVEVDEHFTDGREAVDFSNPQYLNDAVQRAWEGIPSTLSDYHVVLINVSGFNPTALILASAIGAFQSDVAQRGYPFSPMFWAVQFDRERGYLPYEIAPFNGFLREQYQLNPRTWGFDRRVSRKERRRP